MVRAEELGFTRCTSRGSAGGVVAQRAAWSTCYGHLQLLRWYSTSATRSTSCGCSSLHTLAWYVRCTFLYSLACVSYCPESLRAYANGTNFKGASCDSKLSNAIEVGHQLLFSKHIWEVHGGLTLLCRYLQPISSASLARSLLGNYRRLSASSWRQRSVLSWR